nr:glycine-rich RNA-binding protein-like [Penaeus vannamei]
MLQLRGLLSVVINLLVFDGIFENEGFRFVVDGKSLCMSVAVLLCFGGMRAMGGVGGLDVVVGVETFLEATADMAEAAMAARRLQRHPAQLVGVGSLPGTGGGGAGGAGGYGDGGGGGHGGSSGASVVQAQLVGVGSLPGGGGDGYGGNSGGNGGGYGGGGGGW